MNSLEKRQRAQAAAAVVGVDAGKFRHALIVRPRGADDARPITFDTTRAGFDDAAQRILAITRRAHPGAKAGDILVGIEFAGSYGFTFAHFLHHRGFAVVNVLASDTRRWKEVMHHQALKTDQKDAMGITDLVSQGHFVRFAFLEPAYAELRYLVSTRERLGLQRRAAITRLKSTLEVVFPEFERIFPKIHMPTPLALLAAFPGPSALCAAPETAVLDVLANASRGHLGAATYARLINAATATLGLPLAQGAASREVALLVAQVLLFEEQLRSVEQHMTITMGLLPEAAFLLTVPGVREVTAATFLGSVGDVRAYESSRQIVRLAGLSLVEVSSGTHKGRERISKRGRAVLRRHAYILALRSVRQGAMLRAEFEAMLQRNGGVKIKALVALSRDLLKIMYSVARERRPFQHAHTGPAYGRELAAEGA